MAPKSALAIPRKLVLIKYETLHIFQRPVPQIAKCYLLIKCPKAQSHFPFILL